MSSDDFVYKIPRWLALIYTGAVAFTVAMMLVKALAENLGFFDIAMQFIVPIIVLVVNMGRELVWSGAILHISEQGVDVVNRRWPQLNWRIARESVDFIGVLGDWPGKKLGISIAGSRTAKFIGLLYWRPVKAEAVPREWVRHPLVVALQRYFDVREVTAAERSDFFLRSTELGREAGILAWVSVSFAVLAVVLLFSPVIGVLGDGLPNWLIAASGFGAAAVAVAILLRARAPAASYLAISVLIGGTFAALFTVSVHKALFFSGHDVVVHYRLAEHMDGNEQHWQDIDGKAPDVIVDVRESRYRRPGATAEIELREAPFGLYFSQSMALAPIIENVR